MKIIHVALLATAAVLALQLAHANPLELGPESRVDEAARHRLPGEAIAATSMCNKDDEVVFSCPLGDGSKTASMCAADAGRFYYANGKPGANELLYPKEGRSSEHAFTRTHLSLGGNTGGYAYAFLDHGYKYVVYSISGDHNRQDGGVIIQRAAARKVVAKLQCQPGKIVETDKEAVIDATLRWKHDSLIQAEGLPAMR